LELRLVTLGAKFISGDADDGSVTLERQDLSTAELPGVLMCLGTLTDNEDSTFDLDFPGGS
jgi:hypothetical protein